MGTGLAEFPFSRVELGPMVRRMIRWTLVLCVVLYALFAILPARAPDDVAQADQSDPPTSTRQASDIPDEITVETGETWDIARVIRPIEPVAETEGAIVDVETAIADAATEDGQDDQDTATPDAAAPGADAPDAASTDTAEAPAADAPRSDANILFVTGDRVNLRAGPSTDFDIVTALTRGAVTEVLAEADDGWFQIRDSASGLEGFMSGDFLSPVEP